MAAAAAGADAAQRLVPPLASQAAPALRITAQEKAGMLEALEAPIYTTLKGPLTVALLARLNEHVLLSGGLAYMQPYRLRGG